MHQLIVLLHGIYTCTELKFNLLTEFIILYPHIMHTTVVWEPPIT